MDQTTQQNAALVEQAASSAQAMKQQAAALQNQVEFFKVSMEQKRLLNTEVSGIPSKPKAMKAGANFSASPTRNPGSSLAAPAMRERPELVGASAGRHSAPGNDEFEEF